MDCLEAAEDRVLIDEVTVVRNYLALVIIILFFVFLFLFVFVFFLTN